MDSEIWSTLSYGFITYMNPGTHLSDEPNFSLFFGERVMGLSPHKDIKKVDRT